MAGTVNVDYLGSWEVGEGMENAPDVMRDLLKNGLPQKGEHFVPNVAIEIKEDEIVLFDINNNVKQEVLAFYTDAVCNPVAFVNKKDINAGFSRVVIFTVMGIGKFNDNPVLFAVQCINSEPADLVESLLEVTDQVRSRKPSATTMPSMYGETSSFASVHRRTSSTATSLMNINGQGSISSQREQFRKPIPFQSPKVPNEVIARSPESLGFDKPSFVYDHSEDQIQRDTILLNYCIDDIETLCKELRTSRSDVEIDDSTVKPMGEYKATEFTGVFQKIKLAFNLLGRLNLHIRDPNAADIVHHIFPPLAFLMDACLDLFDEDVQREVASPFLTGAAITLLKHCLSSREISIWEACGDYWRLPKSEFDGVAGPYKPLFIDGWSPGYVVFSEGADEPDPGPALRGSRPGSGRQPTPIQNKSDTESDYGSDGSVYNVGKYSHKPDNGAIKRGGGQEAWRDLLMKKGGEIALVTYSRESQNQRELSVKKDDYLEILNTDRKWWKARNQEQEIGFVPYTILKKLTYQDATELWDDKRLSQRSPRKASPSPRRDPSPYKRPARKASPSPRREPSPYRRPPSPTPSEIPPPPPQPAKYEQTPSLPRKSKRQSSRERGNSGDTSNSMADELRNVLSFYKEEKGRNLDIHKTPDIFIDQRSTAREVKEWLKGKQFSDRVRTQMDAYSGRQVLGMKREALETAFGKEEGGRLESQIILSRNHTKYTQGKNSELRAILEKAKKRAEKKKAEHMEDDYDYDYNSKV